jgi:hypothetical protein
VLAGRAIASLAAVAADLPSDRTLVCKTDVSADGDEVDKLVIKPQKPVWMYWSATPASRPWAPSSGKPATGTDHGQRGGDNGARAAMPHLIESRGCASSTSRRCRGWRRLGPGVLQRVRWRGGQPDPGPCSGSRLTACVNAVCPSLTVRPT